MYADLIQLNKQRGSDGKLNFSQFSELEQECFSRILQRDCCILQNTHKKSESKGGDTITGITVNREICLRADQGIEKRVACVKSNYFPIWLFSVGANDSTFSSHPRMQAAS